MEKFAECIIEAHKKLSFSSYILEKTYPITQDPKMLFSVVSSLYSSLRYALFGVLYFELFFKRINKIGKSVEEQIEIFMDYCSERYPYLLGICDEILLLKKIMDKHKESSVELAKKEEIFMFDDKYDSVVISLTDARKHLYNAKIFIDKLVSNFDVEVVDAYE